MTDFRDPNDPMRRQDWRGLPPDDSTAANATWGWVAAAVFVAVVLFIALTGSKQDTQTASNTDMSAPASRMSPPSQTMTPPAMNRPAPTTPSQPPAAAPQTNGGGSQ